MLSPCILGVQYRGGGKGSLSTVGVFSSMGDIMIDMVGNLEYYVGIQYHGGIS